MELIGKLGSNYNTIIGMIPSASKGVSLKILDQCLHIFNNKEMLKRLKGRSKI